MNTQNINNIQNDEIDLIELIFSIWKKKWWVVLCTVIFAAGSALYALKAKEEWTSKAEIIAPRNYETVNILKDRLEYARISDADVGDIGISDSLYEGFMTELRSVNSRVEFFKQSALYKKLTLNMESESEKQGVLRTLVNDGVKIQWPDKKKEIDYPTISFLAETPEDAQQTLRAYLDFLNRSVFALSEQEFLISLNNQIDGLRFALQQTEERLPLERNIILETRKKNLDRALSTAKAAGIKEFAKTKVGGEFAVSELALGEADIKLSDDQLSNNNFLFLMGEKYLQAQMDNVNKIPLVFPPDYHYKKTQLSQLEALLAKQTTNTTDQSFHYQSAPNLPLSRDKPKRALIVLIGTFLGGVIGVLVALFMAALEKRKIQVQSE